MQCNIGDWWNWARWREQRLLPMDIPDEHMFVGVCNVSQNYISVQNYSLGWSQGGNCLYYSPCKWFALEFYSASPGAYMIALIYRVSQKISSSFFARCSGKTRMKFLVNPIAYALVYLDWKSLFSTSPLSKSSSVPLGSLLPPFSLLSPLHKERQNWETKEAFFYWKGHILWI